MSLGDAVGKDAVRKFWSNRRCRQLQANIAAQVDGQADETHLFAHLRECPACHAQWEQTRKARTLMQTMPSRAVPQQVAMALRVLASQEHLRRSEHMTWRSRWQAFRRSASLWRDNLARPFALPFAGGLVSAIVLFAFLAPTMPMGAVYANDVPIDNLSTDLELRTTSILGFGTEDITVDLVVNEQGRVVSYCFLPHQRALRNADLRRSVENSLLFTEFAPATQFGLPQVSRVRLTFRSSHIDVKG